MKKKFILNFVFLIALVHFAHGQIDTNFWHVSICENSTFYWTPFFTNSNSTCVICHNDIYDTIVGTPIALTPDTSTTYILISVDGQIPSNQIVISLVLQVHYPSTVTILSDSTHHVTCPGGNDGSFSVVLDSPPSDYEWIKVRSDSSFFFVHTYHDDFTISGLRGGTYNVIARNIYGCEITQQVTIQQPPAWVPHFEEDIIQNITCGQEGILYFSTTGGTPPYNYEWRLDGDWDRQFPDTCLIYITTPGTYWCFQTDSLGCLVMDAGMFVTINEVMTDTISLIGPNEACYGEEITFTAWSHGHGDYAWSTGDSTMDIITQLDSSSWVFVQFTDQNGCISSDSLWIEVHHPQITLLEGSPIQWCQDNIPLDLNSYVSVTPPGGSLYFNGINNSNGIISHLDTGENNIFIFYNENNCFAYDTIVIEVIPPEQLQIQIPTELFKDSIYEVVLPYPQGKFYIDDIEIEHDDNIVIINTNNLAVGVHNVYYQIDDISLCFLDFQCQIEIKEKVSINDNTYLSFKIYPNPTKNILNIKSDTDFEGQISDIRGQVIIQSCSNSIDLSSLSPGVYFLHLVSQDGSSTVKFIKQ